MGEYAEMMLDGTCCSSCGEFIDFDGPGFPGLCPACKREERYEARLPRFAKHKIKPSAPKAGQVQCPHCSKVVKVAGLADHVRDVHGGAQPADLFAGGPSTIYIRFSDDGATVRKWSFKPFDGGTKFVASAS